MRAPSILLLCLLSFFSLNGQNICGFDLYNRHLKTITGYSERLQLMEDKIQAKTQQITSQRKALQNFNVLPGPAYEIPVIVHIVYRDGDAVPGSSSHPTDAQVQAAIDRLNSNFAAEAGSGNVGASTPIRFALAKRRPDCGATNGIERISGANVPGYNNNGVAAPGSTGAGANDDNIKALSIWPEKAYYNIWVVWNISWEGSGTVTGYATLPINTLNGEYFPHTNEGMIILGSQLINTASTTLTHEMGHAFGLYHTFEGGDESSCATNANCSQDGDKVCDTDPVRNLLSVSCPANADINPCTNNPYNNAQRNIMGYGNCRNRFTQGQSDRMMAALTAVRAGLMTSSGSLPPPPVLVKPTNEIPPAILFPGNNFEMGPMNITLANMTYSSRGYSFDNYKHYIDNTCNIGTTLHTSVANVLSVTTKVNLQRCKAWIDADNSGTFTSNELIMESASTSDDYTHTATIPGNILSSAQKNTMLRMRVMSDYLASSNFGPASTLSYGQTEDFWVIIEQALAVQFGAISASYKENALNVAWTTMTEQHNAYFLVEGSVDGNIYAELSKIESKAANGVSGSPLQYSLTLEAHDPLKLAISLGLFIMALPLAFKRRRLWIQGVAMGLCILAACSKNAYKVDNTGDAPIKYIRITQVDIDGQRSQSKSVRVNEE